MSTQTLEPVRHAVTVSVPPERAFEVFTREVATWWPVQTHSITDAPDAVVFEEREGGEVYELKGDERHHWAWVRAWDPPRRFALEWKVAPEAAASTDLEVAFEPHEGGTRVTLVHGGFERLGEEATAGRDGYREGWAFVLGRYVAAFEG
jgi:activator of Hsp90 ATPase-like protein